MYDSNLRISLKNVKKEDMLFKKIWKIYFSATGTTEKTVNTIADRLAELAEVPTRTFDFTLPINRQSFPALSASDLVVFGCPTYAGRIPNLMLKYLDTIQGGGACAVPVVTFGNRHFDNALIELRNLLEQHGFKTVAAGAFACEHAFSYRLGTGRPDADDLQFAADFARQVFEKLSRNNALSAPHTPIAVDGNAQAGYYQPRDRNGNPIDFRKAKPLTRDTCIRCGHCAEICPMGAISKEDVKAVTGICIKCGACIKKCPVKAKYFEDAGYLYHKNELEAMYQRRAENKVFV